MDINHINNNLFLLIYLTMKNQKAMVEALLKCKAQSGGTSLITYYMQGSTST